MRLPFFFFFLFSAAWANPLAPNPVIRVEHIPAGQGAEIVTVFCRLSLGAGGQEAEQDVPMLAVLRDAPGGPDTERLRQVWMFTYARPSLGQQVAAAMPFFFHRAGPSDVPAGKPPKALVDLANPRNKTWWNLTELALQSEVFDPKGIPWRAPTRGYRGNATDYRNMHVAEALQVLSLADPDSGAFSPSEWRDIRARLILSRQVLGGLVSQSALPGMAERQLKELQISRGHNWELLRQRAEENGLYFQPLYFRESSPGYALLWIAREDLDSAEQHRFNAALLGIRNPWTDSGVRAWKGYQQTWYLSPDGERVAPGTPDARARHMIPLALYALDYQPAPLLLADFFNPWKPKRREILSRAADYAAAGLLGWTGYSNLSYLAARVSWDWLRHRHGANVDRATRISAYAELRQALFFDDSLDPELGELIQKRLDHLAINPFEHSTAGEASIARRQYAALVAYARDPDGLPAELARERGAELTPLVHGKTARILFDAARVGTLGIYRHSEPQTPEMMALLDRHRRVESSVRFLQAALKSGPGLDLVWGRAEISRRLDDIQAALPMNGRSKELTDLMNRVLAQTSDPEIRRLCLACLSRLKAPEPPASPSEPAALPAAGASAAGASAAAAGQ